MVFVFVWGLFRVWGFFISQTPLKKSKQLWPHFFKTSSGKYSTSISQPLEDLIQKRQQNISPNFLSCSIKTTVSGNR